MSVHILHIDTESGWRGGQNQLRLLLKGLAQDARVKNFGCFRAGSVAEERMTPLCDGMFSMPSGLAGWLKLGSLNRWVRQSGITHIDCHSSKGHSIGLYLKVKNPALKLFVHRRVDYVPGSGTIHRRKYLSPNVDRYVAISNAIASILHEYGVAMDKIFTVRSAIDPSPFEQESREAARKSFFSEFPAADGHMVALIPGALTEQKGHEYLIRAVAKSPDQFKGCLFYCAGVGKLEDSLKSLCQSLGVGDQFVWIGFRDDVPKLLKASDVVVWPSTAEGLGTGLLEAGAANCAVVATRVGGIPEIIEDGVTGWTHLNRDPASLAAALSDAIKHPDKRKKRADALTQHVRENFSVKSMVEGNLALYLDKSYSCL